MTELTDRIKAARADLKRPSMWRTSTHIIINNDCGCQIELTLEEAKNTAEAIVTLLKR